MIGDLHCHTRLSDGSMGIEDVVFYAKRMGLDFVAITDHDTMAGVTRATVLGQRYGIGVIPGVEISCVDTRRGHRKVHMLCYLPKKPMRLESIFQKTLNLRTQAGQRMIDKVVRLFPVTREHILRYSASSKSIYKQHIMQALMDLGYTSSIYGELYDRLFSSKNGLCYEYVEYPDVYQVINMIRSAQGIACLAHPRTYDSFELLEELAAGHLIDAVEQHHPRNLDGDDERIGEIAGQYGLITTGGSDFHGSYTSQVCPISSRITTELSIKRLFSLSESLGAEKRAEGPQKE
ncbi:PHP domain-containing protein [Candidatus Soleaferrea massiliensis]|uniref:PHP domain-containing protein n=1 Tax=Candidatus Soleaferrea massiliensis TaxID=1470354 RepID=UPI00058E8089|nr:PHP domain-containing protein [Candidatus Soleaferrea massiliensis]